MILMYLDHVLLAYEFVIPDPSGVERTCVGSIFTAAAALLSDESPFLISARNRADISQIWSSLRRIACRNLSTCTCMSTHTHTCSVVLHHKNSTRFMNAENLYYSLINAYVAGWLGAGVVGRRIAGSGLMGRYNKAKALRWWTVCLLSRRWSSPALNFG